MKRLVPLLPILLAGTGTALLAAAMLFGPGLGSPQSRAVGTVVDVLPLRSDNGGPVSYSPVVEFETADGQRIEFRSTHRSNPPDHAEGDHVPVFYSPADPGSATLEGRGTPATLLGATAGAALILTGAGMLLARRRRPGQVA